MMFELGEDDTSSAKTAHPSFNINGVVHTREAF